MSHPTFKYSEGGTVQARQGTYIERKADPVLYNLCKRGQYANVLTTRQMGKSSLMIHIAEQLENDGIATVIADLSGLGKDISKNKWYNGFLQFILDDLDLGSQVLKGWHEDEHLGHTQRLQRFFEHILEHHVLEQVVIFVDEIDSLISVPFASDFFAAIRAMYNARSKSADSVLHRLSFVLIGVATPSDLIVDANRTPYNIGTHIDLTDFDLEHAKKFAEGIPLPSQEEREKVLKWVYYWTHGHPYLTQKACKSIADSGEKQWTRNKLNDFIADIFLRETSTESEERNLQFVRDMLTLPARMPAPRNEVLDEYYNIRKRWRPSVAKKTAPWQSVRDEKNSVIKSYLKICGIVRKDGPFLVVRNRIYESVFNKTWVDELLQYNFFRRHRKLIIRVTGSIIISVLLIASSLIAYRATTQLGDEREEAKRTIAYADSLKQAAENDREVALKEKEVADSAAAEAGLQAKAALQEAKEQGEAAVKATNEAKLATEVATKERQIAEEATRVAEEARSKAEAAISQADSAQTRRLRTLGVTLAAHAIRQADNENIQVAGLLAIQAHQYTKEGSLREKNLGLSTLLRTRAEFEQNKSKYNVMNSTADSACNDSISDSNSTPDSTCYDLISDVVLHSDAHRVATVEDNGNVRIWNVSDSTYVPIPINLKPYRKRVFAFSPDGLRFALADNESVRYGEVSVPDSVKKLDFPLPSSPHSIAFTANNHVLFAEDKRLYLWKIGEAPNQVTADVDIETIVALQDALIIAGSRTDGLFKVSYPDLNLTRLNQSDEYNASFGVLALHPSGEYIASGSPDGNVYLWKFNPTNDALTLSTVFDSHTGPINSLSFDTNGLLASASNDRTIKIWNIDEPDMTPITLEGHTLWVRSVAFYPDGKQLISGGADRTLRIWQLDPQVLTEEICKHIPDPFSNTIKRPEWDSFAGPDIPFPSSCNPSSPKPTASR